MNKPNTNHRIRIIFGNLFTYNRVSNLWTVPRLKVREIDRHFMHERLLSAKDLAQMQYSQKRLVMDFYLQFFSSNLDFTSDPIQIFRFLDYI